MVSVEKSTLRTNKGLVVEISCIVTGEPLPRVSWYKGDEVTFFTPKNVNGKIFASFSSFLQALDLKKGRISAQAGANNRYSLVIKRLRSDDEGR